jgi:hypothetical protein
MQYQVPQFIEVEDKIFGPFTAKQFIYMAGSGGVALAAISLLPFFVAIIVALPIVALGIALAFYTVNGRPFITVLENMFNYGIRSKLYLWNAERAKEITKKTSSTPQKQEAMVPRLSESKLRDLSWSLNIKDRSLMGVQSETQDNSAIHEGIDLDSIKL